MHVIWKWNCERIKNTIIRCIDVAFGNHRRKYVFVITSNSLTMCILNYQLFTLNFQAHGGNGLDRRDKNSSLGMGK